MKASKRTKRVHHLSRDSTPSTSDSDYEKCAHSPATKKSPKGPDHPGPPPPCKAIEPAPASSSSSNSDKGGVGARGWEDKEEEILVVSFCHNYAQYGGLPTEKNISTRTTPPSGVKAQFHDLMAKFLTEKGFPRTPKMVKCKIERWAKQFVKAVELYIVHNSLHSALTTCSVFSYLYDVCQEDVNMEDLLEKTKAKAKTVDAFAPLPKQQQQSPPPATTPASQAQPESQQHQPSPSAPALPSAASQASPAPSPAPALVPPAPSQGSRSAPTAAPPAAAAVRPPSAPSQAPAPPAPSQAPRSVPAAAGSPMTSASAIVVGSPLRWDKSASFVSGGANP
ncbi:hypothetical protein BGX34_002165 [Mortierella sp. NVP85]|nr:hypothetical protein BGX34_002165 [Mortierella sp. NVP85]